MSDISSSLREEVVLRASNRCEYCRLSQLGQEAAFPIDHVVPRAVGGPTLATNLALACVSCSLRKWAKQTATDPDSGEEVPLYNPRTQAWGEHFRWEGKQIVPITPTGRATVDSLPMNQPMMIAIRQEERMLPKVSRISNLISLFFFDLFILLPASPTPRCYANQIPAAL